MSLASTVNIGELPADCGLRATDSSNQHSPWGKRRQYCFPFEKPFSFGGFKDEVQQR
jgi:hypothetical protein